MIKSIVINIQKQFRLPHTRGSSHGASRITRYAYPAIQPVYTQIMLDAFPMWAELEKEYGEQLFQLVYKLSLY
jgi:hypothetical protein